MSTATQAAQVTQQSVQASTRAGQQAMEAANPAGQQGEQDSSQDAQQGAESANQGAQQGARGGGQVAREGAPAAESVAYGVAIKDFDNLRTRSIVEQLDKLSPEELQATRAYEQENKNRDTLLQLIDRRINAAS